MEFILKISNVKTHLLKIGVLFLHLCIYFSHISLCHCLKRKSQIFSIHFGFQFSKGFFDSCLVYVVLEICDFVHKEVIEHVSVIPMFAIQIRTVFVNLCRRKCFLEDYQKSVCFEKEGIIIKS